MAKPVAFGDERLDADLWAILGPWDQKVQDHKFGNRSVGCPSPCIEIGKVSREEAASDSHDDASATAGAITSNRPQHTPISISKISAYKFFPCLMATGAAILIAIYGLGHPVLTEDAFKEKRAISVQGKSVSRTSIDQMSNGIEDDASKQLAVHDHIARFTPLAREKYEAVLVSHPTKISSTYKSNKRLPLRHRNLSAIRRVVLHPNTSGYESSIAMTHRIIAPAESPKSQPLQNVPELPETNSTSTRSLDQIVNERDRRESVRAIRSLRRQ